MFIFVLICRERCPAVTCTLLFIFGSTPLSCKEQSNYKYPNDPHRYAHDYSYLMFILIAIHLHLMSD